VYICTDDPDLPVFYFDSLTDAIFLCGFTPKNALLVSHKGSIFGPNDTDDDEFELPGDLLPFLKEKLVENDMTVDGIAFWWASDPYNRRSGRMRLAQDFCLVKIGILSIARQSRLLRFGCLTRSCSSAST
jgi:pre-mRNA-processing factor 8